MKSNKKLKIGKLNFYIIDDTYIGYLSQFDKHIAYNKNEKRPYIGVVLSYCRKSLLFCTAIFA